MSSQDPYAKYGGSITEDPYTKYGGSATMATESLKAAQAKAFPTEAERGGKPGTPVNPSEIVADWLKPYYRPVAEAVKGGLSGIGASAISGVPLTVAKAIGTVPPQTTPADIGMEQRTTSEKVGGALERAGEFLVPGGATERVGAALGLLQRAGLEGATAYGVSRLHGDTTEDSIKTALAAGGVTAAGIASLRGLEAVGKRSEASVIRPLAAAIRKVKDAPEGEETKKLVGDIYKYNLGGSLSQTLQKTETRLGALEGNLKTALGTNPAKSVDLQQVLLDAAKDLTNPAVAAKYNQTALAKAFERQIDELDLLEKLGATSAGKADLLTANQFKRSLGKAGSWVHGFRDPDSEASEILANAMYSKVRQQIENQAGAAAPNIRAINKQMGDLMPIAEAAIKRIPVASRNHIIGLKQVIGLASGNTTGMGLSILDQMLSRSGVPANIMVKTGQKLAIGPRLGQAAAGIAAAAEQSTNQ